ncbi:MAG: LLM class flavin-dependent oxidoreductase, partial [Pseudomonadales bacterium]|nr:LLM class flavin-dependent oxidoreductase [Pseudomonadales bacterium]
MESDQKVSFGVMCAADFMSHERLQSFARQAESAGLDQVWVPELLGRDPFVTASVLLSATRSIRVGTAIANVYVRDARATKAAAFSLTDAFGERFDLGLGVSNPIGNEPRGHAWLAPVAKLTDFVTRY